jgi:hypothetical protein
MKTAATRQNVALNVEIFFSAPNHSQLETAINPNQLTIATNEIAVTRTASSRLKTAAKSAAKNVTTVKSLLKENWIIGIAHCLHSFFHIPVPNRAQIRRQTRLQVDQVLPLPVVERETIGIRFTFHAVHQIAEANV